MLRIIPPFVVLGIAFAICYVLFLTEPEPGKMPQRESIPEVVVESLRPVSYQVMLKTQGSVQARTESTLISEVRGTVNSVAPAFQTGGFFEEGDLLLEIDSRNYVADTAVADASVAQAELKYAEEVARAKQAEVEWTRLNPDTKPSDLVLRLPQVRQAEADIVSARARLENARLNLERTRITAPYAGRLLSKEVDVGQYVSTGSELARIYAVDYAEIRLPLSERQLGFLDMPAAYRGVSKVAVDFPEVTLESSIGGNVYEWSGRLVRAEGAFDASSRQLFVVAQIDNPYAQRADGQPPLKVGSFVQAIIEGTVLENVFVIPRELYRKNEYLVIIGKDDRLQRRAIDIVWSDEDSLVVRSGVEAGERIAITALRFPSEGMKVKPVGKTEEIVNDEASRREGKEQTDS